MNTAYSVSRPIGRSMHRAMNRTVLKPMRICILILSVIILTSFAYVRIENHAAALENAKSGVSQRLYRNLSKCADIARKMTYAGADIEKKLYPELRHYLYAAFELNEAVRISFGEEYAPVSGQLVTKIRNACTRLEACYSEGKNAREHEAALADFASSFSNVLDRRFTDSGSIVPLPY